jgi:hypothetical protein
MLGSCQPLPQHGVDALEIESPESPTVEPKPGEADGAKNSVGPRFQRLKSVGCRNKPEKLLLAWECNEVLVNADPLV